MNHHAQSEMYMAALLGCSRQRMGRLSPFVLMGIENAPLTRRSPFPSRTFSPFMQNLKQLMKPLKSGTVHKFSEP